MSSFLGRIFGTQSAIEDLTDKDNGLLVRVGGWANDLHYSEQEEARDSAEARAERIQARKDTREWGIRFLESMSAFKVVQRILAFVIAFVWAFLIINIVAALWLTALADTKLQQEAFLALAKALIGLMTAQVVLWPTISCFALYFTGGVVDSFRRPKGLRQ